MKDYPDKSVEELKNEAYHPVVVFTKISTMELLQTGSDVRPLLGSIGIEYSEYDHIDSMQGGETIWE